MPYFHNLNPVAFNLFELEIKWYGVAYAFSFIFSIFYLKFCIQKKKLPISLEVPEGLSNYVIISMILGARIFYIIFYNLEHYVDNPFEMFNIQKGGLSFHGGILAGICGVILFAKRNNLSNILLFDLIAIVLPFGIFLGRIGNFINGELFGKITTHAFGMIFSTDSLGAIRHPSQLYEATLEGAIIFIIINFIFWHTNAIKSNPGLLSYIFIILYCVTRIVCEIFREPEIAFSIYDISISMGQILTFVMLIVFIFIFKYLKKNEIKYKR